LNASLYSSFPIGVDEKFYSTRTKQKNMSVRIPPQVNPVWRSGKDRKMNLKNFQAKAVVEGHYLQPGLTGKDELRGSIVYSEISIPAHAYHLKTISDISGCGVAIIKPGYKKSPSTAFAKFKLRSQSDKTQRHFVICNIWPTEIYQSPWLIDEKGQILFAGEAALTPELTSIFGLSFFRLMPVHSSPMIAKNSTKMARRCNYV